LKLPPPGQARALGTDLPAWFAETRLWADAALERCVPGEDPQWPPRLAEAMRYALFGGGKRLRPALVRLFARALGGTDREAELPGAAVELVHTYSLVHDDLPCMDDDDLRRGRATCHVVYGEALAVLAGDALLTRAFELLAQAGPAAAQMVAALARGAGPAGMVGGQVLDLEAEGSRATRATVDRVHRTKTAALIESSCELGALAAGADPGTLTEVRAYGLALGLGFQAVDDLLDLTGDAATLGKTPGKDERHDRANMARVIGLEAAREAACELAGRARSAAAALGFGPGELPVLLVDHLLERRS
jgi:geranylgeranyl pyrophosphate synthase